MRCPRRPLLPRAVLLGVALGLVFFLFARPSPAQVERRYVLGRTVTYAYEATPSLTKSDLVPALASRSPRRDASALSPLGAPSPRSSPDWTYVALPVFTGALGGALGGLVGGLAGAGVGEAAECTSFDCLAYPAFGAIVGETVGLSSGVYLGTDRRGSYALTLLGGMAGTAVGLGLVRAVDDPLALLAVPVVQFAVTIPIARSN
jgi:hypothetical protein